MALAGPDGEIKGCGSIFQGLKIPLVAIDRQFQLNFDTVGSTNRIRYNRLHSFLLGKCTSDERKITENAKHILMHCKLYME